MAEEIPKTKTKKLTSVQRFTRVLQVRFELSRSREVPEGRRRREGSEGVERARRWER